MGDPDEHFTKKVGMKTLPVGGDNGRWSSGYGEQRSLFSRNFTIKGIDKQSHILRGGLGELSKPFLI